MNPGANSSGGAQYPVRHERRTEEFAVFTRPEPVEWAVVLTLVEPDKLLPGLFGSGQFPTRVAVRSKSPIPRPVLRTLPLNRSLPSALNVARGAGVPHQRMSILPARTLLQENIVAGAKNQDVDSAMAQLIPMHFRARGAALGPKVVLRSTTGRVPYRRFLGLFHGRWANQIR